MNKLIGTVILIIILLAFNLGVINENQGLTNVAVFLIWGLVIVCYAGFIQFFLTGESIDSGKKNKIIKRSIFFFLVLSLIWHGWFITGAALSLCLFLFGIINRYNREKRKGVSA